jgi:hypothetical protein
MASSNNASLNELVFKPVCPVRVRLSIFLYPVGILACIFFIHLALTSLSVFPNIIYTFIFGIITLTMPMILFREVRFGNAITLKRYFRLNKIIRYEEVVDFTLRGFVAKYGGISLANVQNRSEFEKIIKRLGAQRKIIMKK